MYTERVNKRLEWMKHKSLVIYSYIKDFAKTPESYQLEKFPPNPDRVS